MCAYAATIYVLTHFGGRVLNARPPGAGMAHPERGNGRAGAHCLLPAAHPGTLRARLWGNPALAPAGAVPQHRWLPEGVRPEPGDVARAWLRRECIRQARLGQRRLYTQLCRSVDTSALNSRGFSRHACSGLTKKGPRWSCRLSLASGDCILAGVDRSTVRVTHGYSPSFPAACTLVPVQEPRLRLHRPDDGVRLAPQRALRHRPE